LISIHVVPVCRITCRSGKVTGAAETCRRRRESPIN
jgi:hypothetical protein